MRPNQNETVEVGHLVTVTPPAPPKDLKQAAGWPTKPYRFVIVEPQQEDKTATPPRISKDDQWSQAVLGKAVGSQVELHMLRSPKTVPEEFVISSIELPAFQSA